MRGLITLHNLRKNDLMPKKTKNHFRSGMLTLLLMLLLGIALAVLWKYPLRARPLASLVRDRLDESSLPIFIQEELLTTATGQVDPLEPMTTPAVDPDLLYPARETVEPLVLEPLPTQTTPAELVPDNTPRPTIDPPFATLDPAQAKLAAQPQQAQALCGGPDQMTILLLGIDQMAQADAIRMVRIDFVEPGVTLLSIPRDLYVPIPGLADHGIRQGRINATFGYGEYFNGTGAGVAQLSSTLEANFGVTFDHYFVLHFSSIERYINQMGGVDIDLLKAVDGRPDGYDYFSAGKHHLDGKTAVGFMRIRVYDSDFRRVDRQSLVLTAAYEKALSLSNTQLLGLMMKALVDQGVYTDMSLSDGYSLLCLGSALTQDQVEFVSLPSDLYRPATTTAGGNVLLPQPGLKDFILQTLKMD